MPSNHFILSSPSPPAFSLSQHSLHYGWSFLYYILKHVKDICIVLISLPANTNTSVICVCFYRLIYLLVMNYCYFCFLACFKITDQIQGTGTSGLCVRAFVNVGYSSGIELLGSLSAVVCFEDFILGL